MATQDECWTEVTASQFPHEAEGLALVRALLPNVTPFRAWSNFEFRDSHGKWHEIDLLVLGQHQLHRRVQRLAARIFATSSTAVARI